MHLLKQLPSQMPWRAAKSCYCSRVAQTAADFADASHSKSAKSVTTTVSYGIFSSENAYPCTVTKSSHSISDIGENVNDFLVMPVKPRYNKMRPCEGENVKKLKQLTNVNKCV